MAGMARRVQITAVVLLVLLVPAVVLSFEASDILVSYSFDDTHISTGPDTLRVFEYGKGRVKLTTAYRYSGYYAVEIRDVQGDGDFPELLGYFKLRTQGMLFAHFAFLTTDPADLLNIALVGPQWFTFGKDGFAWWIKTESGWLYHVSDSMPKKLFPLKAFTWYIVDVSYNIDEGVYDLVIHEERVAQPIVILQQQKNAANQPGSAVDKFSFVTDPFGDRSQLTYYIDDVVIGVDEQILQLPIFAPGRRKLFVDMWDEQQFRLREKPVCLPAIHMADFGITAADLKVLQRDGLFDALQQALTGTPLPANAGQHAAGRQAALFEAIHAWQLGCEALAHGQAASAHASFTRAVEQAPDGRIYGLSRVLALAALRRWDEVDTAVSLLYADWAHEPRFAIAQALIGLRRGDLDAAETWLRLPADAVPEAFSEGEGMPAVMRRIRSGEINQDVIQTLKRYAPDNWQGYMSQALVAEQYFYVLLWQGLYREAKLYALRMVERLAWLAAPQSVWLERAGDAALFLEDYRGAQECYEKSLQEMEQKGLQASRKAGVLLKLSDVHFLLNDLVKERLYREKIYGSLLER
jgi:hypothetical protein